MVLDEHRERYNAKPLPPDPLDPLGRPRWQWLCNSPKRRSGGVLCRATRLRGTNVCAIHGGKAPQVQRKAQERIDEAAFSIVSSLVDIVLSDERYDAKDRIAAAKELLSRTHAVRQPQQEVKHTGEVVPSEMYAKIIQEAKAKVERMATGSKVFAVDNVVEAEVVEDDDE